MKRSALCGTERDPVVQARLARIAISARRCPAEPAETFFEALNTMLLLKELGNGLESMGFAILGHVDRVLAPYYARDVQLGRLTVAQAQELVYWFCAMTDAKWDLSPGALWNKHGYEHRRLPMRTERRFSTISQDGCCSAIWTAD